jgi:putative two-component system response regulator
MDLRNNKTVLLVDSNQATSKLYATLIMQSGYQSLSASHLSQANQLINDHRPDLIILATEFTDGSGTDFCRRLKSQANTVLTPVILLSSKSSTVLKEAAFSAGAIDFIERSASPVFVQERIRSALLHRQLISFTEKYQNTHFHILVAEDSAAIRALYCYLLNQLPCTVYYAQDGQEAWKILQAQQQAIDLIITDLNMPIVSGTELTQLIRSSPRFDPIPIIVVSSSTDHSAIHSLLSQGANDYLTKPFANEELMARLNAHLRLRAMAKEQQLLNMELKSINDTLEQQVVNRTREIYEANIDAIYKLAIACDCKDHDTANHINRVRMYVQALAQASGLDEIHAKEIGYASMMHDIGKIAIPDQILNKPGSLDSSEWEIMKGHTIKGAEILGDRPFFKAARDIALCHHEKFDGSGYPNGLKGRDIPLGARILAVVDVYDALMAKRPYKAPWPEPKCVAELTKLKGQHLDPELVELFLQLLHAGHLQSIKDLYPQTIDQGEPLYQSII